MKFFDFKKHEVLHMVFCNINSNNGYKINILWLYQIFIRYSPMETYSLKPVFISILYHFFILCIYILCHILFSNCIVINFFCVSLQKEMIPIKIKPMYLKHSWWMVLFLWTIININNFIFLIPIVQLTFFVSQEYFRMFTVSHVHCWNIAQSIIYFP